MPWANCAGQPLDVASCQGSVNVTDDGNKVLVQVCTGPLELSAAEISTFKFDLLVTPLRPLDLERHFSTRYYHVGAVPPLGSSLNMSQCIDVIAAVNATYVIVHQGNWLNPWISYPLLPRTMGPLEQFVAMCHERGLRVKLYLTERELSSRCSELFAFHSLPANEILKQGSGGGGGWLRTHLCDGDYSSAWSQVAYKDEGRGFLGLDPRLPGRVRADEAVAVQGGSRFDNFWVEETAFTVSSWPRSDGL
eukprot:SAG31_NODE_140_length_22731_cov_10.941410_18_plen_249_part_00